VIVVSDTSPVSNLILVDHIHLLPQLFGTIIIPEAVYQELLANGSNHPITKTIQAIDWLEVCSVTNRQQVEALERDCNLDPGEANAIVLALELQATQLLIDERLGRLEAKRRSDFLLFTLTRFQHRYLLGAIAHPYKFAMF
jgi:predicted nucleic acid-binding protein